MKLYHYTTFTNFCSIWIQQKLKFSGWTNCNDVYEREKMYNFTLQSKEYKGKRFSDEVFRQFTQNVFKEVELYRQISFCLDYKDIKGYASPMMWGHYARDYQRSGVCLEIDSSKIKFPQIPKIYRKKVSYRKNLTPTHVGGVDAEMKNAAELFVVKNRNNLFFKKHWHWKYENEYRIVSKECEELDISGAITSVYVLGEDDVTLQSVNRIIMDSEKVGFLNVGGLKSLRLNSMNLYDYNSIQEEIKYINEIGGLS
jgi:hypothetical protein